VNLSRMRRRVFYGSLIVVTLFVLNVVSAFAQCPLCRLAVENSTQGQTMGRGLNLGILVLLVPPVTVFCGIFIVAMKHRRTTGVND
jgi:hypothetical protein